MGIIGTNGSGTSTILKIITGVLTPTAGEVKVDGRISALLELGAGFNMEYSGLENVYLNGTMIGFSKEEIDARLNDILEFADIGDFIHQPVKTYSSGMFVRLAFAVAINIDPEILVVDEALSVGDVFFQAKCYHKFEEFKKQGKTILFVSHDLGSVSKYCDRVILLNKGVKMNEGSPKQMVDLYKQLLVGQNPVKQNESDSTEQIVAEDSEGLGDFQVNPNMLEYGSRIAEITDFRVIDDKGRCSNTVEKGSCRLYQLTGTKGFANKYPVEGYAVDAAQMKASGVQPKVDNLSSHSFLPEKEMEALVNKYQHPILKKYGEMAKEVGGHGGMDFIMDSRMVYCLQNGLPLDMDVYDLAEWCALAELGAISMDNGCAAVAFPDFTRGHWNDVKGFHHAFATPEDEAAAELAAETATLSLKAQGMKEWLAKSKKAEVSKEEAEARVKQLSDQLEKTQKKANGAESKELKDAVKQAEKMLKQAQKMLK